jgi:hypothetical protein
MNREDAVNKNIINIHTIVFIYCNKVKKIRRAL